MWFRFRNILKNPALNLMCSISLCCGISDSLLGLALRPIHQSTIKHVISRYNKFPSLPSFLSGALALFIFVPLAGISQLLFLHRLSLNLSVNQYSQALVIMNLSLILCFLDYGVLYTFFFLAIQYRDDKRMIQLVQRWVRPKLLGICLVNLTAGVLLIMLSSYIYLGIYLILFAINSPAHFNLVILRTHGRDLIYQIIYNLSWPCAVVFIFAISFLGSITWNPNLAFLPLFSSIFVNYLFLLFNWKDSIFGWQSNPDLNASDIQPFKKDFVSTMVHSSLNTSFFAIATQGDKFIAIRLVDTHQLATFLTYGQIATSIISVLNFTYLSYSREKSDGIGESQKLRMIFWPGIIGGIIFVFGSFIFLNLFLRNLNNSPIYLLLGFLTIASYGVLFSLHSQLFLKARVNRRTPGFAVQCLSIPVFWMVAVHYHSLILLQFCFLIGILANIFLTLSQEKKHAI